MEGDTTRPSAGRGRTAPVQVGMRVRDYIVEDVIASGGFGTVYRARHQVLGRRAAIKVLHPDLIDGEALIRFEREARVVNRIHHPNIVDIFDIGELPGGVPFFLMELLGGSDLGVEIASRTRFAPRDALEVLHAIAVGLAAAHLHGVIHRDVKASNVMLDPGRDRGRVVLLDFGVAKILDHGGGVTATSQLVGSPCCNSPEQIEGRTIDARTDVYGLAVLAFHMLTGSLPFALDAAGQLQHLSAPRPRASTRARLVPEVDTALARGMAIAPDGRQAGPQELVAELAVALARQSAAEAEALETRSVETIVVRCEPLRELDEALAGELAQLGHRATAWLDARGFALVRELPGAAVYLRGAGTGADPELVARELSAGVAAPPAIRVAATARRGSVQCAGGVLWSGALLDAP